MQSKKLFRLNEDVKMNATILVVLLVAVMFSFTEAKDKPTSQPRWHIVVTNPYYYNKYLKLAEAYDVKFWQYQYKEKPNLEDTIFCKCEMYPLRDSCIIYKHLLYKYLDMSKFFYFTIKQ